MENKAMQVLDQQIAEAKEKITQAKISIADAVINAINVDIRDIKSPKDMLPVAEEIEKMPKYLSSVKENEKILAALTKSRDEISTVCSEEPVQ